MIPDFNSPQQLMNKLDLDISRYEKVNHPYTLLDCFLTLNALPEWIERSTTSGDPIHDNAKLKHALMSGKNLNFDESLVGSDLDQDLRLVRLVCNQAKHKADKPEIPVIQTVQQGGFPYTLPIKFDVYIAIGTLKIDAENIVKRLRDYWKSELGL